MREWEGEPRAAGRSRAELRAGGEGKGPGMDRDRGQRGGNGARPPPASTIRMGGRRRVGPREGAGLARPHAEKCGRGQAVGLRGMPGDRGRAGAVSVAAEGGSGWRRPVPAPRSLTAGAMAAPREAERERGPRACAQPRSDRPSRVPTASIASGPTRAGRLRADSDAWRGGERAGAGLWAGSAGGVVCGARGGGVAGSGGRSLRSAGSGTWSARARHPALPRGDPGPGSLTGHGATPAPQETHCAWRDSALCGSSLCVDLPCTVGTSLRTE